jgi:hypothetical protein
MPFQIPTNIFNALGIRVGATASWRRDDALSQQPLTSQIPHVDIVSVDPQSGPRFFWTIFDNVNGDIPGRSFVGGYRDSQWTYLDDYVAVYRDNGNNILDQGDTLLGRFDTGSDWGGLTGDNSQGVIRLLSQTQGEITNKNGLRIDQFSIITPTAYTITPSASSINEGQTLTTNVRTTGVAAGTTLYYSLSGSGINASDFSSGALMGSATVAANGSLSFSHTLRNDLSTEGNESMAIRLFSDPNRTTQVGSTATVTVVDTSRAAPTYTITPSASSINEGQTLTTNVRTSGVAARTTLYYSLSGTGINANDFSSGALRGSATVAANGTLSFSHTLRNDLTPEGNESLAIRLFSDPNRTTQVGSTATVTVVDTSRAAPTYTITPSASSINEGQTLTTNVRTSGVAAGTTLYWSLSGTGINANDFSSGALTGSATVAANGTLSFAHTLRSDLTTEGNESLAIRLFSDANRSQQVGSTATVTVVDTSRAAPTYTITPSASSINEGQTLTTNVRTTGVAAGTTLYYSLSGSGINASDFSSGALMGSGTVAANGSLSFSHTLRNDLTTEGNESLAIRLFSDANRTQRVGNTATVTLVDSSRTHAFYTISPSTSSINEGDTLTTTVNTTGVAAGTTLYYALSGKGINTDDFSSGGLTGSGSVTADGTFTFSNTLANDITTEGDESLLIHLYSDPSRTKLVRSASLAKIIDTSRRQIPESLKISAPESIMEGGGGSQTRSYLQLNIGFSQNSDPRTIYYTLSGSDITASDFSPGYSQNPSAITSVALTGSKALSAYPNNSLNICYQATTDRATEGNEILNINIYSDPSLTTLVGTADTVIYDASKSPPPSNFDPITGQKVYFSDLGLIESGKVYGKDDRWTSEDRLRSPGFYGNLGFTKQDMQELEDFKLRFDFSDNYISITTSVRGDKRQVFNAPQTIGKDWTSRLVIQGSFEYSEDGLTGASLGAQASQRISQTPAGLVAANGNVANDYYPLLTDNSNYSLLPVNDISSWKSIISTYQIGSLQTPPGYKANYFNSAGGDPKIQYWVKDFGNGQFFYNGWETNPFNTNLI